MLNLDTYTQRIAHVIDAVGIDVVTDVFNTSQSQVYRIKKDASTLSFNRVVELAKVAGINTQWISTGLGDVESIGNYSVEIPHLFETDAAPFILDRYFFHAEQNMDTLFSQAVLDDAMENLMCSGSMVVIDKSIITGNGIFGLMVGGVFTLRNIKAQVDGSIKISALKANYDDMTLPKESLNLVDIVGRVIWSGQNHG
ncbi:MAG: hypothetical protein JKY52_19860 [Flavobacteriales bacterium]|nr:hypothetical protein [Flavobacteriales bacterium]